jgi:hypothetical protein
MDPHWAPAARLLWIITREPHPSVAPSARRQMAGQLLHGLASTCRSKSRWRHLVNQNAGPSEKLVVVPGAVLDEVETWLEYLMALSSARTDPVP